MAEENKKRRGGFAFYAVLTVFATGIAAAAGSLVYNGQSYIAVRNFVMAVLGALLTVFLFYMLAQTGKLDFDNKEHFGRFVFIYLTGLGLTVLFPSLPVSGWPFMVLFAALCLFSSLTAGMAAGSVLLMTALLFLPDEGMNVFILYFICGLTAAALMQGLDEEFKIGIPVFLSLLSLIVCETANIVLFTNEKLSLELFIIPAINTGVCAILMIAVLKLYSGLVIHKYKDKYVVINDQEFPLMVELKEKCNDDYYHVIHTAYLSGSIAQKLSFDTDAVKTASYYLKIGKIRGANTWENVQEICRENQFPPAAVKILEECIDKQTPKVEKETAAVLLSDTIIASIRYAFSKDKEARLDYDQVVEKIFKKKIDDGLLKDSRLTYQEVQEMKKIFKEEKLYYDFLR